ncbi:MAG: efflux RND transporter periplasmic adaptor subunit [Pirellulaceae bacterium]
MRFWIRFLIIIGVLGGAIAAATPYVKNYLKERNKPTFRFEEVTRGKLRSNVRATGTIKPRLEVIVGSFVSGPIVDLLVDFNDEVKAGQLMAKVDPRIYDAAVARDEAALATRLADVERAEAVLQQAINDERRSLDLYAEDPEFISQAELDQYKFARKSLEAQLVVAQASVKQAQANLDNSLANRAYTEVTSPTDGTVIDRKIDEGQTLAAQFQAPELFIVAPGMREEMYVYASIDEMDIGRIRLAQERSQPVQFQVSAYPDDIFEGTIKQIRFSSTVTQNVVTYPVVVSAPNPDLKLLPGMTADLTFQIEEKQDVLRVPRAALRYYPGNREWVHPDDRKILDGPDADSNKGKDDGNEKDEAVDPPDADKDPDNSEADTSTEDEEGSVFEEELKRKSNRKKHVWIQDGEFLRAIEVTVGLTESKFAEVLSGELKEGQKLVVDVEQGKK